MRVVSYLLIVFIGQLLMLFDAQAECGRRPHLSIGKSSRFPNMEQESNSSPHLCSRRGSGKGCWSALRKH